jgi:hypothetical protein
MEIPQKNSAFIMIMLNIRTMVLRPPYLAELYHFVVCKLNNEKRITK